MESFDGSKALEIRRAQYEAHKRAEARRAALEAGVAETRPQPVVQPQHAPDEPHREPGYAESIVWKTQLGSWFAAFPVAGVIYWTGHAHHVMNEVAGWMVLAAIVALVVNLIVALKFTCPSCGHFVFFQTTSRAYEGSAYGTRTEMRTSNTYRRDPMGGGGVVNPSIAGYGIYPEFQTKTPVTHATQTDYYRVDMSCPKCRASFYENRSTTRDIS